MNLDSIIKAQNSLSAFVRQTPLQRSEYFSHLFGEKVYLKLENWQKTGSFKIRGALHKISQLSPDEKSRGIITASAGNHALGVANAAKLYGIKTKIIVPADASAAKIHALNQYNLDLIVDGNDYDEAEEIALEIQRQEKLTFVHAFSDETIISGQGTIALEILEQLPDVKNMIVPVGGGGLISGMAVAAKAKKTDVKIVGVQSEASPAMFNSLQVGMNVETPIKETIADGLAGRFVTDLTLHLVQEYVDDMTLVSENAIKEAVKCAFTQEHLLLEGSAAVGLAAILENKLKLKGETAVILTGRNISLEVFKNIIL